MKYIFLLLYPFLFVSTLSAQEISPYSSDNFSKLHKEGRPIILDFHVDWCSICRKQFEKLKEITREKLFPGLTIFKVDIENENELREKFNVTSLATLIILNKGREIYRTVKVTNKNELKTIIKFGLSQP